MRARFILAVVLAAAVVTGASAQPIPAPPFYQLLPFDYPHSLIRACSTQWGICAIPVTIVPGAPCQCRAANGQWLPGLLPCASGVSG